MDSPWAWHLQCAGVSAGCTLINSFLIAHQGRPLYHMAQASAALHDPSALSPAAKTSTTWKTPAREQIQLPAPDAAVTLWAAASVCDPTNTLLEDLILCWSPRNHI